jgi:hypothetical protein
VIQSDIEVNLGTQMTEHAMSKTTLGQYFSDEGQPLQPSRQSITADGVSRAKKFNRMVVNQKSNQI